MNIRNSFVSVPAHWAFGVALILSLAAIRHVLGSIPAVPMRVLLTSEAKFERTPDGTIWGHGLRQCRVASLPGRVFRGHDGGADRGCLAAIEPDVSRRPVQASTFCSLPSYSGLAGFCRHIASVHAAIGRALDDCPAVIVRSPSPIAYLTVRTVSSGGRAYGAHIVGRSGPGVLEWCIPSSAPRAAPSCGHLRSSGSSPRYATAVLFVTNQRFSASIRLAARLIRRRTSTLDDAAFGAESPRDSSVPFTLVTVGALDQPYKGTAVLLDAVAQLQRQGSNGAGAHRRRRPR